MDFGGRDGFRSGRRSARALCDRAIVVKKSRRREALKKGLVSLVLHALFGFEDFLHDARATAELILHGLEHGFESEKLSVRDALKVVKRAIEELSVAGETLHGLDELRLGGLAIFTEAFFYDFKRRFLHDVLYGV